MPFGSGVLMTRSLSFELDPNLPACRTYGLFPLRKIIFNCIALTTEPPKQKIRLPAAGAGVNSVG